MGTGLVTLNQARPGVFKGSGDLGMGGHWRLQLLVYLPYLPAGLARLNVDAHVGT
jgi:hypothetical protein